VSWFGGSSLESGVDLCVWSDNLTWHSVRLVYISISCRPAPIPVVCSCTQSEKSWSCDLPCCRVDCGGGLGVEDGTLWMDWLLLSAAFARSSRNLSNSEKDMCSYEYTFMHNKGNILKCYLYRSFCKRKYTFTRHSLANWRLLFLLLKKPTNSKGFVFFCCHHIWVMLSLTRSQDNHLSTSFCTEFFSSGIYKEKHNQRETGWLFHSFTSQSQQYSSPNWEHLRPTPLHVLVFHNLLVNSILFILFFCVFICVISDCVFYLPSILAWSLLKKRLLISMGSSWLNKGYNDNNNLNLSHVCVLLWYTHPSCDLQPWVQGSCEALNSSRVLIPDAGCTYAHITSVPQANLNQY